MAGSTVAERVPVAVLISGRGSNLGALLRAAEHPSYPARIVLVISNRADAGGLDLARAAGVPTEILPHRAFPTREAFDAAIQAALVRSKARLVALAGFMRRLTPALCRAWEGRMINIHPSLLPSFPGLDTHARALEAGVRVHGCTVHLVTPELDAGPILAQGAVPVLPGDSEATLAARVLAAEHRLYPMALAALAEGRIGVDGQRTAIEGARWPETALFAPLA